MKLLIHFICEPDPRIGYGVCALNFKKELDLILPNNSFQIIVSDPRDKERFSKICNKLLQNREQFKIINIHLTHGLNNMLLALNLPGYKVLYTLFESEILPLGMKENAEKFDLVLTASKWGADILCNELTREKVEVAPLGVDPLIFHSWELNQERKKDDPFIFLAVGKYEKRKSYEEIIEAFELSFSEKSKNKLLLRLDNLFLRDTYAQAAKLIKPERRHQILIVKSDPPGSFLKVEVMAQLYRSSHCFLFPSKGEGWGLPLIEAISCGIPYIATNYSGHTEFLRYCNQSYSDIKYTKELIEDKFFLRYQQFDKGKIPSWAKPDYSDLSKKMIFITENWRDIKSQALLNSEVIHQKFSWRASTENLLSLIIKKFS